MTWWLSKELGLD